MDITLDSRGLKTLIKGSAPYYNEFENALVKKAGHEYSDQYGRTSWRNLDELSDEELYQLYLICRYSWD